MKKIKLLSVTEVSVLLLPIDNMDTFLKHVEEGIIKEYVSGKDVFYKAKDVGMFLIPDNSSVMPLFNKKKERVE